MEISAFGLGVTIKGLAGANQCTTIGSFDHGFRVNVKVIEFRRQGNASSSGWGKTQEIERALCAR